jgi:type I restriction enzyme, R subunit
MLQRIAPRWKAKAVQVRAKFEAKRAEAAAATDGTVRAALADQAQKLERQK